MIQEQAPPTAPEAPVNQGRSSAERLMEAGLMLFAATLFGYVLWESQRWSFGVALLPRIASIAGIVVLVAYAIDRFRPRSSGAQGQIMDLGFDEGDLERRVVVTRTLRFVLTTAAFFVGLWLVGFHIAVPIYVFAYLIIWGNVRWWVALLCAAFFEAFMIVAYDIVIRQNWPEPVIKLPFRPFRS